MTTYITTQRPAAGTVGGVEVFVSRLVAAFPEVQVIEGRGPADDNPSSGVQLRIPGRGPRALWFTLRLWAWLLRHRRHVDKLVVNRVEHGLAAVAAGVADRSAVVVHGSSAYAPMFFGRLGRIVQIVAERICVRKCADLCVLMGESEWGLPYYRRAYPDATSVRGRSVIVPPQPLRLLEGECSPLRLVYLGRLEEPVKRISALAHLSADLLERGIDHKISIFGDGPDRELLESVINALGVATHVHMAGPNFSEAVPGRFHIGLLASRFEGMSMATLELLASGIPVVGTTVGDLPDYATWGAVRLVDVPRFADSRSCGAALGEAVTAVQREWSYWEQRARGSRHLVAERWFDQAIGEWAVTLGLRPDLAPRAAEGRSSSPPGRGRD